MPLKHVTKIFTLYGRKVVDHYVKMSRTPVESNDDSRELWTIGRFARSRFKVSSGVFTVFAVVEILLDFFFLSTDISPRSNC